MPPPSLPKPLIFRLQTTLTLIENIFLFSLSWLINRSARDKGCMNQACVFNSNYIGKEPGGHSNVLISHLVKLPTSEERVGHGCLNSHCSLFTTHLWSTTITLRWMCWCSLLASTMWGVVAHCDHSHVLPLIKEAEAVSIIGGYERNWFALLTFSYFCHHACCTRIFTVCSTTFETTTDVLLYY